MKHPVPFTLFLALLLCTPASSSAQSPYQSSREKDCSIIGAGGITATAGFFLYKSVSVPAITEIGILSRESVNGFDRSAIYHYSVQADKTSDILFGIAAAAPFILLSDNAIRDDWKTFTLMYVETWSFIGGTSLLGKGLIERYRPYAYNPNVSLDKKLSSDAKMSFFSNHTTTAFASAVFLSTVYSDYNPNSEWKPYVWAGSLLTASVVGYLRYEAGMHFPTDILAGAIVGSAIGVAIPWMHRSGKENLSITPGVPRTDYGFSIQVKF